MVINEGTIFSLIRLVRKQILRRKIFKKPQNDCFKAPKLFQTSHDKQKKTTIEILLRSCSKDQSCVMTQKITFVWFEVVNVVF